jgi:hypothetical protein
MKDLLGTVIGPFTAKIWLGLLGLALIIGGTVVVISKNRDEKLVDTGREAGAATAVVAGQADVLNQVERANDAEQEIAAAAESAAFDRCVRNSTPRSRASCDRFRPVPD